MNGRLYLAALLAVSLTAFPGGLHAASAQDTEYKLKKRGWDLIEVARSGKLPQAEAGFSKLVQDTAKELGAEHRLTLLHRIGLASVYFDQRRFAEAEAAAREVLADEVRLLGEEDADTLRTRGGYGLILEELGRFDGAVDEWRKVLAGQMAKNGEESGQATMARGALSDALMKAGKLEEAGELVRQVVVVLEPIGLTRDQKILNDPRSFVRAMWAQRPYDGSMRTADLGWPVAERLFGPEHLDTLLIRENVVGHITKNERERAAVEYRGLIKLQSQLLGEKHERTLTARTRLAGALWGLDRSVEALPEYAAVVEGFSETLGAAHPEAREARRSYARLLEECGYSAAALEQYRELMNVDSDPAQRVEFDTLKDQDAVVQLLNDLERDVELEREAGRLIEMQKDRDGITAAFEMSARRCLALRAARAGRSAEAENELRKLLAEWKAQRQIKEPILATRDLTLFLFGMGQRVNAEAEMRKVVSGIGRNMGIESVETLTCRRQLGTVLLRLGKVKEAEGELRQTLAILDARYAKRHAECFRICAAMAVCLAIDGRREEAVAQATRAVEGVREAMPADDRAGRYYAEVLRRVRTPGAIEVKNLEWVEL